MKRIILFLVFIFVAGCGGISMITTSTEDLYSKEFIARIENAKGVYSGGDFQKALNLLNNIKEETLLPSERAMKRNLMGVINFSAQNYEQAIFQFNIALSTSSLDKRLTAQIHLNLASSYYRLGDSDNTLSTLLLCQNEYLEGKEFENYHKLRLSVAKDLGNRKIVVESLISLLKGVTDIVELKSMDLFGELISQYFALDVSERTRILKDFSGKGTLISGYVTYLEVEQLYAQSKREEAVELIDWLEDEYEESVDIMNLVSSFKARLENFSTINPFSVGVVLPLTGKRSGFGQRALAGIDHAVREFNRANKGLEGFQPLQLHVADSAGSSVVGKRRVNELIETKNVSLLIGGLFSNEALSEYLEARKYGTFFVSLSQIFLDKSMKDHMLVEVPGSVESQVSTLFSEEFLTSFGNNGAIIYPNDEQGRAYVDEFWRKAKAKEINLYNVQSFDKEKTDHRETVQRLLGLKYTRERQEELEILKELHKLEGATSIRRIQTLKPEIDFDWVFIPASPSEALQLIPSFSYYDAFNIPLIGSPQWRSRTVSRESYKLGRLYFVDSNVPHPESTFIADYERSHGKKPRLIEVMGYEAFKLASEVLGVGESFKSRAELEDLLKNRISLNGLTGVWTLEDNSWIKKMNMMSLYRGRAAKLDLKKKEE
jgi:outer membrane PBP1 activator LpoA protein